MAAAGDVRKTLDPAVQPAAQCVEIELIADRGAKRTRDQHAHGVKASLADKQCRGDKDDLAFEEGREQDEDVGERSASDGKLHYPRAVTATAAVVWRSATCRTTEATRSSSSAVNDS